MKASPNGRETSNKATRYYIITQPRSGIDDPFSLKKRKRYQYLGPGTFLKKRFARGDPGINRLDRIAKQHVIDYSNAKNIRDKWKADLKMVNAIDALPGKKSRMEKLSRNIIAAKRKFKLQITLTYKNNASTIIIITVNS